jgi:hypothetical protein
MIEIKPDKKRVARPKVLAVIEKLVTTSRAKKVHYLGYAHEPVLRLLLKHVAKDRLVVTDRWDRYHTGAAFFWEGEEFGGLPCPGRPEWLEGVPFCQDGIPRADLLIWDVPVELPEAVNDYLHGQSSRQPPEFVLLVDEGCAIAGHPDYAWTIKDGYALGVRQVANPQGVQGDVEE